MADWQTVRRTRASAKTEPQGDLVEITCFNQRCSGCPGCNGPANLTKMLQWPCKHIGGFPATFEELGDGRGSAIHVCGFAAGCKRDETTVLTFQFNGEQYRAPACIRRDPRVVHYNLHLDALLLSVGPGGTRLSAVSPVSLFAPSVSQVLFAPTPVLGLRPAPTPVLGPRPAPAPAPAITAEDFPSLGPGPQGMMEPPVGTQTVAIKKSFKEIITPEPEPEPEPEQEQEAPQPAPKIGKRKMVLTDFSFSSENKRSGEFFENYTALMNEKDAWLTEREKEHREYVLAIEIGNVLSANADLRDELKKTTRKLKRTTQELNDAIDELLFLQRENALLRFNSQEYIPPMRD